MMLKWTKQQLKEMEGQEEKINKVDKHLDIKKGDFAEVGCRDIPSYQPAQEIKQPKSSYQPAQEPKLPLYLDSAVISSPEFCDRTSKTQKRGSVSSSSTKSPDGTRATPLTASQTNDKVATGSSSMSLKTTSSLKTSMPQSTQYDPRPQSKEATGAVVSENSETETSMAFQQTQHSQEKPPHEMSSALPDIARSVPSTEREVLGPDVNWEQENLTMNQIAEMDNFPCVCFFEEKVQEQNGQRVFLSAGLKIYSRQPVLLHMKTRKRQARVRTIFKDPRGAYYEVGQTMIIPDDYQGWFEVVPSDFRRAACFMSIGEVAKAMPRKFFTRSNIRGIRIEGEGDQQKYLERKIGAGSVLETKGTFTAKWRTRAETGLFKQKTREWDLQEVTYLKCMDMDQLEVLVPLSHKGKFNAIYERGQLNQNAVYSMKDVLSDLSLPIKVRLLFGKAPVVPCIFTGMLVVRSAAVDDAIVGSTILNKRNVLFEISTKAPVKVKTISTVEPFAEMATYKDAEKLCRKYANLFSTMIKLSPDLDTDQKVIMHVPSDPSVMRQVDESLRALDLITDISFTGKPKDHLLEYSDSGSMNSDDQVVFPKWENLESLQEGSTLEGLQEFKSRESHTHV